MRSPRLAETPHQRVVAGFQENEDRVETRHLPQLPENLRERRQQAALAYVDDDGHLLDVAAGAQRQPGERRDQHRRQVVDAEVAEILERSNRLRLAGPRQPGENDERLTGSPRLPDRRLATLPAILPSSLLALRAADASAPHLISSSSSSA